jgi:hypothetical protein
VECFLGFFIILIIIVTLLGVTGGPPQRHRRASYAYQQLAQRYGGSYSRRGWWGYSRARFRYRSAHVQVGPCLYPSNVPGRETQIDIEWIDPPGDPFRCDVSYPRQLEQALPRGSMPNVRTGCHEFDRTYLIRGTDPQQVQLLLNSAVRWQIDRLRQMLYFRSVRIEMANGRLLISKGLVIHRLSELQEYVHLVLELYDQIMLTRMRGIEYLEEHVAQPLDEVKCKVCGDVITENLVFCRRCKTPHHLECWQYNGRCSVFACSETRFDLPRVADRVHNPEETEG